MTERSLLQHRSWLEVAVLGLTASFLLIAAAGVMFSVFMFYDDEGYVLNSYRAFLERGALYREVYTQYGPFPFIFYQLLDALGIPLTHTAGRVVTLAIWAGTALGCAALVRQASRSLPLQLAVLAGTFVYLWILASEPSHPGGLIVALIVGLAVFGAREITAQRIRSWAIASGVATALAILTKINVGGFLGCSVVAWWALHHIDPRVRRLAQWILPVGAVILPLALMRPLLGTPWVQNFAAVFAASAVAVILTIARTAPPRSGWAHAGWAALAGLITAMAVLTVVLVRGSTIGDLLEGILLGPLRHPVAFSLRYIWPPGIVVVAAGSLLLAGLARLLRPRCPRAVDTTIASLRLTAALALAWNIARYPMVSPDYATFGWVMPCLWLFLWPLSDSNLEQRPVRAWVGLLLLGQCLHVFPVPGSQIAWGTVLAVPAAALGAWEAVAWLLHQGRPLNSIRLQFAGRLVLLLFVGVVSWKFMRVAVRYNADDDLRLPGAESLRLPAAFSAALRVLVVNAEAHADVLFSFPGMFSFNLWSGVPTPTGSNVTHWFSLLNPEQQKAIIRSLESSPRACVIVHREHIRFLTSRGLTPSGSLRDYIEDKFVTAFTVDDYEFRVHRGRSIALFMVAEILTKTAAASVMEPDTLLQLPVLLPNGSAVASVEIVNEEGRESPSLHLNPSNTRIEATPLTPPGTPAAPSAGQTWPYIVNQPTLLSFYYHRGDKPTPRAGAVLVLRDGAGNTITTGRLRR